MIDWLPPIVKKTTIPDDLARSLLFLTYVEALKSKDPSTQLGSLIVDDAFNILSRGHNGFPEKVIVSEERLSDRNKKLFFTEHAERKAIYKLGRTKHSTEGKIMICPWFACSDCARGIIESGIKKVVGHKQMFDRTPERWIESIYHAFMMFQEAGVECELYDGFLNCNFKLRFNGEIWEP